MSRAEAYAQAQGGLAAVTVHVSPGLGTAMGMLYEAYKAPSPLLLTAGQHDQSFTVTEPILWSDLPPVATPFVKWSTEARRLEDLPRIVRRAVKTALAQPSGPVFLSLPVDVLNAERDNLDLLAPTRGAPRLRGDSAAIDAAARLLAAADTPLIVAGDAVAHSDARAALLGLAELIGAPGMPAGGARTCSVPSPQPPSAGARPTRPGSPRWDRSPSCTPSRRSCPTTSSWSTRRSPRRPASATSSAAPTRRRSSACAAAASAGACRRRSA